MGKRRLRHAGLQLGAHTYVSCTASKLVVPLGSPRTFRESWARLVVVLFVERKQTPVLHLPKYEYYVD